MGSEGKSLMIFNQTKQTREIAGKFAADTVEAQSKEFQSWGLMADWENRYRLDRDRIKRKSLYVIQNHGSRIREAAATGFSHSV